jgi:hypothetical protein
MESPYELIWDKSGFAHDVIERIDVAESNCFKTKYNAQSAFPEGFAQRTPPPCTLIALLGEADMNGDTIVKLIEEMVDIKVHQQAETHLKPKPEFARLLEEKRFADRRRLELIKQELARLISQPVVKIVERE